MRRWMRDRAKRRKQQQEKQGQDQPTPLQPRFPDPIPDDIGNRIEATSLPRLLSRQTARSSLPLRLVVGRSHLKVPVVIAAGVVDAAVAVAAHKCHRQLHRLPRRRHCPVPAAPPARPPKPMPLPLMLLPK